MPSSELVSFDCVFASLIPSGAFLDFTQKQKAVTPLGGIGFKIWKAVPFRIFFMGVRPQLSSSVRRSSMTVLSRSSL